MSSNPSDQTYTSKITIDTRIRSTTVSACGTSFVRRLVCAGSASRKSRKPHTQFQPSNLTFPSKMLYLFR